ncbi:MAG: hypothetical protein K2I80_08720 [Ruminococcus sp.]|nr:hypothetical protein [Ruminococcus sp.]
MSIPYFNAKTKCYPDGSTSTVVFDSPTFRSPDWSLAESLRTAIHNFSFEDFGNRHFRKLYHQSKEISKLVKIDTRIMSDNFILSVKRNLFPTKKKSLNTVPRSDSLKRAKDRIFDYILCNEFDYFFTGTIDPKKFDSQDPKAILKYIQNWLKNLVRRNNLKYVFVSERHKSGRIHFHGLIKGDNLNLVDSGTKLYKGVKKPVKDYTAIKKGLNTADGRIVYNLSNWKFGFTTCINLVGDPMNTAFYVTKYITKDCKKIFGKFFWHSRGLKKPEIRYENIDYDSIQAKEYFNEHTGHFKYVFRRGDDNRRIEQEKEKSLKQRSILEKAKQLLYDVVNDLVVNRNTGEVLEYVTFLE